MSSKIDHRRLARLRRGQGEIANHVIDEFAAGRLSRRDFIRRATVVGIAAPALGSILAACGSSASSSSSSAGSSSAAVCCAGGAVTDGRMRQREARNLRWSSSMTSSFHSWVRISR